MEKIIISRLRSNNVIDVSFNKNEIIESIKKINKNNEFKGENKYYKPNTVKKIIEILLKNGL